MKRKRELFSKRLAILIIVAALMISFVAVTAYTADDEKPELTASFKPDVAAVTTPATPSNKSADPIIWVNGTSVPGGILLSSQNDVVYPFVSQMADDFVFATDALVTDVHWWGGFWNGDPFDPCDFYIYIYADDGTGNMPSGAGMADPSPTALASYYFPGVSGLPLDPNGFYEYDVDLSPGFSAAAGVKYWIGIQADFAYPPQWGWTVTSGVQLHQAMWGFPFLGAPFWTDPSPPGVDMAFYLTGIPDEPPAACGDVNGDGAVNVGDVVYLVAYLYKGGPAPIPQSCVGDVNNDDAVNVGDVVYLVTYLYKGGPAPDPSCCNPPWK